jgi:signal transduction histidine kinase
MIRRPSVRPRSIAARLYWLNALVCGIALILAYIAFLAYNLVTSRHAAVNNLTSEAQIIGANSISAILYNDPAAATNTLAALSNSNEVTAAAIYTQSGELFAQYPTTGPSVIEPRSIPGGRTRFVSEFGIDVLVAVPILLDGKVQGTVYIQAHLQDLRQHAIRYALIAAGILIACLFLALLSGTLARRLLSEPIVSLADTARLVTRYRDYSLRFQPTQRYNELESVTQAFNEMLEEIQHRDAALEQARNELEHRVEERTAQLRVANRELESFSYTVAHDLRGPLEIISNICFLIQNPDDGTHKVSADDPMLQRLGASVSDMSHIIDDLLNLSRASSAGLHLNQLDLTAMVASILNDLATTNPDRHVECIVQPGCYVTADKGLMLVVMQNLLRNAWKFSSRNAAARIEFGCTNHSLETIYFVRDNGAGFDQRHADRLFKPFQRLHAETEFAGSGIGLATVQRIINRHEGTIWAEGEIGKGAAFYFSIGAPAA